MTEFTDWLYEELQKRNLSMRQASLKAGLSHTMVSDVLSEKITVTPNFCLAIAKVLNLPGERVLRRAGLLPPAPGDTNGDMTLKELWSILQTMDHAQLKEARRYLLYLARTDRTPAPETVTR